MLTQDVLNVSQQMGVGKHLGLPSLIGRKKKEVFAYLCERVWKKTRAWKANQLPRAGRKVLIKSMAQSMQTYAISIFMPPISLCGKIQKMFNAFWWCGEEKGIRLLSWKQICIPKNLGEMGLCSLHELI